jgi:hypothetical protein
MESILMRVHTSFKKWCDKIKEENKTLSSVEITALIVRHNSSDLIKESIKELGNEY